MHIVEQRSVISSETGSSLKAGTLKDRVCAFFKRLSLFVFKLSVVAFAFIATGCYLRTCYFGFQTSAKRMQGGSLHRSAVAKPTEEEYSSALAGGEKLLAEQSLGRKLPGEIGGNELGERIRTTASTQRLIAWVSQ
jgi:hypothetical protein